MAKPRDASERIGHVPTEKVEDLLSHIHSELTENEMRELLEKVNSIARESGLEAHFSVDDPSEDKA